MSLSENFRRRCRREIQQFVRHGSIDQASVLVQKIGGMNQFKMALKISEHGELEKLDSEGNGDDTAVYAIGSLTKLFVAALMCKIVNTLSLSKDLKHKRYRRLRKITLEDPWAVPFTTLFNYFSDKQMAELPGNPSLRQVLLHYCSLPHMTSTLLAPEGTSLLSESRFLRVATRLAKTTYSQSKKGYLDYSNGNHILVGMLIEAIGGDSLSNLMKREIFDPLRMYNTYMSVPESGIPVAQPHIVSIANGERKLSSLPPHPSKATINAAMGGYSNTRDISIFILALLGITESGNDVIGEASIDDLFKPGPILLGNESDMQTFCGTRTTLDTSTPGSKSINRLSTPADRCSTYSLGLTPHGKQVRTIYSAGAVMGYSSCLYIMRKWKTFVIVLTNTSGRTDGADHISRYILQELFDLKRPSKLPALRNLIQKAPGLRALIPKDKVDVIDMSSRSADKGEKLMRRWASEDSQKDMEDAPHIRLEGSYFNEINELSIVISPTEAGSLCVTIGADYTSRKMGLIRTGDRTIRLCPSPGVDFSIDRYDPSGWKELNFELTLGADDEIVVCLTRRGDFGLEEFKRQELIERETGLV